MDRSSKLYIKALDSYDSGEIDKSLEICEKSISENIKNAASINLKGLLFYLKGDLNSAEMIWKMNYQVNKDNVSKKYLENIKADEERSKLYKEALKYIKELKIREAQGMLLKCTDSDYNYINVNNSLSLCYIKIGEYDKALNHIEKVLKIDKKNQLAKEHKNTLIEYSIIKKKFNYKMVASILLVVFIVSLIFLGYKTNYYKNISLLNYFKKNDIKKVEIKPEIKEVSQENQKITEEKAKTKNPAEEAPKEEPFPYDEVKKSVDAKDFEKLYEYLLKYKDKDLKINDKTLYVKAEELMKNEGIIYFYTKGSAYLNSKDYTKSKEYLLKGYNFGEGNYLYPHIVYMLATSFYNSEDIENSIKYYKEYDDKFPQGDYEETILYQLAIIYKNIDIKVSKTYAEKLSSIFPKSIYNNSNIKDILKS